MIDFQIEAMFDQQDYYSEEEENLQYSKQGSTGKVLLPNSGSDFNHLTEEGQSLLKMMQERGFDLNDQELKKLKTNNTGKDKQATKPKQKAGFFDGGASASLEELLKALNKALTSADPQQASVILSHILQKKTLIPAERNKFGIMKCKILFGLGAYQDCLSKAQTFMSRGIDCHLAASSFSNYLAKSRAELDQILDGYMDFLRAKAHMEKQRSLSSQGATTKIDQFQDSELDTLAREIDHTEMEYNIRMTKYKNATNLVHPYFPEFRHRQVLQVVAGDYHTLFLVGGPLGVQDSTQVFGLGQNSVGQVLGKSGMEIVKEPTLIVELSGKRIQGLAANRESSIAWDDEGRIYEWGIKQKRDESISVTFELGERIVQLQKGYQHYAALLASGKFYTWGSIFYKGTSIYNQKQPTAQPAQNIAALSCGNSHIAAIDTYGDMFVMGSNEFGQLGLQGQLHAKAFKKLSSVWIGPIRKMVCLADSTFMITRDEELFFCGKISHNKENIERPRQGEFTGQIDYITSVAGTIGNYYLTTANGELYHWDVDSSVKFKIQKENQHVLQRAVVSSRGSFFKIRSLAVPELTKFKQITEQACSYEDIVFEMQLFDYYGPYGARSFVLPPHCQIFLSTYDIKADDLLKENTLFLDSYQFSLDDTKILLNEIVESRLSGKQLQRDPERPSVHKLTITCEESGKFYFYVLIEEKLIYSKELFISVSEREKELSEKNKRDKEIREEERHRKAEIDRQRLLQSKLKKEAEVEERQKETQKRAEQAFKKHMRQQEELKTRAEEDRKARKELVTGGGFDLSKLKAKNQKIAVEKQEVAERSPQVYQQTTKTIDPMMKSGESFLPDINQRPNSRRKINLPSKNSPNMTTYDSVRGERPQKVDEPIGSAHLIKSESNKEKDIKPMMSSSKGAESMGKPSSTGSKMIVKRGLSKGKK